MGRSDLNQGGRDYTVLSDALQRLLRAEVSVPHLVTRRHRYRKEIPKGAVGTLTAMHCLMMQDCFILPGPPNFFMSLQK